MAWAFIGKSVEKSVPDKKGIFTTEKVHERESNPIAIILGNWFTESKSYLGDFHVFDLVDKNRDLFDISDICCKSFNTKKDSE